MFSVFESLLPVFLIVFLGWSLRRFRVVPMEKWEGVEQLGYWVLFPALLFNALINGDLTSLSVDAMMVAYLAAFGMIFALLFLLHLARGRYLSLDGPAYSTVFQTSTRWNIFISFAVMDKYAGAEGLAIVALVIAIAVLPLNIINIVVIARSVARKGTGWRQIILQSMKNPMIISTFLGIVVILLAVPIYEPVRVTIDIIGSAGLSIGLLAVGAGIRIRSVFQARPEMLYGLVGKMVIFPLLVLPCGLIAGVSGVSLVGLTTCAATPAAMHGYIVARKMGGDADLYATTIAAQVLLALISIPFFLWLAQQFA